MPIILAIEPDRRQRDALSAVVRQRVGAELILADTTEHALEAIGNRVPDLVLVPALLSPQDDAALAAALRVIAAAAHVRTLTIPVLAAHTEAAPSSGLLSRWRRGRAASTAPDGCDPAVFAEQISAYLKEGAAERALRIEAEEHELLNQEPPVAQEQEPQYAQEFGLDDFQPVQSDVPAAAERDVPDIQPDVQTYAPPDVPAFAQPAYEQPETPAYAQSDVPVYAQSEESAYARSEVQSYTQPEAPAYAQPDERAYAQTGGPTFAELDAHAYAQPDTLDAQQEAPAYLVDPAGADLEQDPIEAELQPVLVEASVEHPVKGDGRWEGRNAVSYIEPDEPQMQADVLSEQLDLVEGDEYDRVPAGTDDALSTLQLDEEEDIDLSDELDELETEEPGGMRVGAGEMELFDGEPVGVYVIDEPEEDNPVLAARRAFAEAEAEIAVDPEFFIDSFGDGAFDAAGAESALDAEAAVDREFFADSFAEPAFEPEAGSEPEPEAEAAVARAFDAETHANSPAVDDIDPEDAEPEPADAEPWASAFLSPRWVWPVMEGVPTEQPPAFAAVEAVAAAVPAAVTTPVAAAVPVAAAAPDARPAPAPHKRPEWSELVASLRKDIERRRVEPPQEKPKAAASVPVVARRSKKSKPIQDEWGFFDPEQCGFAALLAKLDEITETAEEIEVRQSSVHQSS